MVQPKFNDFLAISSNVGGPEPIVVSRFDCIITPEAHARLSDDYRLGALNAQVVL
jgi:hypothetical protein